VVIMSCTQSWAGSLSNNTHLATTTYQAQAHCRWHRGVLDCCHCCIDQARLEPRERVRRCCSLATLGTSVLHKATASR
jgi:hypothetical protein